MTGSTTLLAGVLPPLGPSVGVTEARGSNPYVKDGKEIEIRARVPIEGDEEGGGARVSMRMATGSREFQLGERVSFSAEEFQEIALGCWAFANDLSRKLPILKSTNGTSQP